MFRQDNFWVWMLALMLAGLGWNLHLAAWAVEMNLWGATAWAFGTDEVAKVALSLMNHLYTVAELGSAIMLAAGLLAEASNSCPKARPVKVRV